MNKPHKHTNDFRFISNFLLFFGILIGTVLMGCPGANSAIAARAAEAPTYTITYDANGGTNAPASQIKTQDVALSLQKDCPQREGHLFLGWGISKTSGKPDYRPGDSYHFNADLTLYALWERRSYPVRYDAAEGSFSMPDQTKLWDIPLTLHQDQPQRKGYTFLGWGEGASALSASYAPGAVYEKNAPITLFAVWQKNKTVSVRYNANGGSGAPKEQKTSAGEELSLSKTAPTKDGCYLLGWTDKKISVFSSEADDPVFGKEGRVTVTGTVPETAASVNTVLYAPGSTFSPQSDQTLYACWHQNRKRSISGTASYKKKLGAKSFSLNAALSPAAGNPLTYQSSDKSVATVSSAGTVSIKGIGSCVITIRSSAGIHYASVEKKIKIKVILGTVNLSSVTSVEKGKLTVKWKTTPKVQTYECKIESPGKNPKTFSVPEDKNYRMTLTALESGRSYTIRLRAVKKLKGKTHRGAWSSAKKVCVK